MPVELIDNSQQVIARMKGWMEEELNAAADEMVDIAQSLAPVDTGLLRDSISVTKYASPDDLSIEVTSAAPYAGFQEFGTRFQVGTPHVTPAYEKIKQWFRQIGFSE